MGEVELLSTGWVSETSEGSGQYTTIINPVVYDPGELAENSSIQEHLFTDFSPGQTKFGVGLELPGRLDPNSIESAKFRLTGEFVIRAYVRLDDQETGEETYTFLDVIIDNSP